MFKILVCINNKNAIGKDNKLLYHISQDLKNFKKQTLGNVVIMGKKTFESLPNSSPLKGRVNVILTRDMDYAIEDCDNAFIVHSVNDAVLLCDALFSDKEWFVIGGASLYKEFLDMGLISEVRLTIVNDDMDGDVYFPKLAEEEWGEYFSMCGMDNNLEYTFKILKHKNGQQ